MDLQILKSNLEKRGFLASYFKTGEEAVKYLNDSLNQTSIGMGGSITIKELNLYDTLASHNFVWWHGKGALLKEFGSDKIIENASHSKYYICTANGVSLDGQIVNIDGRGNRIASTCFGHEKVYILVPKNKVSNTLEDAIFRARNVVAPKNAQRLQKNTPCAIKGDKCYNCNSKEKICRGILIFEGALYGVTTEIVLIDEDYGY